MTLNFLLVTFSLRNHNKDYSQFFVALRGNALQWWHYIEQTCVVVTYFDVQAFAERLRPHLETTDSLLVVRITPHDVEGWLPEDAWKWLNAVSERIEPRNPQLGSTLTLPIPPLKLK